MASPDPASLQRQQHPWERALTPAERYYLQRERTARIRAWLALSMSAITVLGVIGSYLVVFTKTTQKFEDELVQVQQTQQTEWAQVTAYMATSHADMTNMDERLEQRFDALMRSRGGGN